MKIFLFWIRFSDLISSLLLGYSDENDGTSCHKKKIEVINEIKPGKGRKNCFISLESNIQLLRTIHL